MNSALRTRLDSAKLDLINSGPLSKSLIGNAVFVVAATGLVALAAHISLPLPFSPVPLTLQPFAVVLIGMVLGPVAAFSSMILYLAEGAMGLPVFTPQGPGGVAQLLGPTAGFLFSYPFAAGMAGWIARSLSALRSPFARGIAAGTVATAIIFVFGASWLASLLHLDSAAAWHLAVVPFLPGEVIKIIAAATLFSTMRRWQQT